MASAKDFANRVPITVALMLATVMNSLDTTIANVALPHMQGSLSASQDQITWVLTSYIIAAAIMTPLTGWLSVRIGRKQMFLFSIAGFTVASMLCGAAANIGEIVAYRLAQGICGAALIPLSQATVLDIFPAKQVPQVMSIWGMGTMLGPIMGPLVGGYLTDNFSWRWVFYINLPVGILAFAGVWLFMGRDDGARARPFDFVGFAALVLAMGAFQLMMDRGSTQDWFNSGEIWIDAILAAIGFYVFLVQTLTAAHPFFDRALALDRNFVTCNIFGFFTGLMLFSTMALFPPMMQTLLGYSVWQAGVISMPRGIGTFISMFLVGRLVGRVDIRLILLIGLSLSSIALWQMSRFDLSMNATPMVVSGFLQGLGMGLLFMPLSVLAFATLPPHLRPEGTSVFTLVRNLGSSIGIALMTSILARQLSVSHSDMAAAVQPGSPTMNAGLPAQFNPALNAGLQTLNGEITRQASMVAYVDVFRLMTIMTFCAIPMLLIMRPPRVGGRAVEMAVE
ncbi:MAG: DHA2 family efflux MFS transporter permease subunit [Caulobacterales bacterium]